MARRHGFVGVLVQVQREAARQQSAALRAQTQAAREAERARKAYERARMADQKERATLYAEARAMDVALDNDRLERAGSALASILTDALAIDPAVDLQALKEKTLIPTFAPGPLAVAEEAPSLSSYLPEGLTGIQRLSPFAKKRYAADLATAYARYHADEVVHAQRDEARQKALRAARGANDQRVAETEARVAVQHAEIDAFARDLDAGVPDAVVAYLSLVLEASPYPDDIPRRARMAYLPESRQLVVERDLPPFGIVPEVGAYKYVKTKDEVTTTARPVTQRRILYTSVVAQTMLRTLHELFGADRAGHLETIVVNGYVDAIDPATGQPTRTCVATVRATRETFVQINLAHVEPVACLKALNASVSKSPSELAPVRPVLEFDMVDPRFVAQADVLTDLDRRPNLMDLTPSEFESLIANLFGKMGLETRQTQASRDGGVDCVAYDPRPILGGKVVIQAKRYKHTVGVSAVRDLFGTLQNEGASKGILVTTSGYGKAAFDFAQGKPLELLSGSNLLYLLAEYAGIEAKIEAPADWKDPTPDADADGTAFPHTLTNRA